MDMSTGSHDTQPEGRHVTTDPGLGVTVRERTDPGVAPVVSTPATLERVREGVDRDAETPVPPISLSSPARDMPRAAARIGGDPTPVPPELTDGLLSGLIASENEAYFRKAKAGSESSGEAAAAFHGKPHVVAPGNPTPPPEPPVLLRRSVEVELADREALARANPPPVLERKDRDTDPPSPVRRMESMPEPTVPLPEPRTVWTEKAIAFGLAVLAVGALGIIVVRWVGGSAPAASQANPTRGTASTTTAAPPVAQGAPAPEVQIPPPPTAAPAPAAVDTAVAAEPLPAEAPPVRPGVKGPRVNPGTRRAPAQNGTTGPVEVVPPPKDDVKRQM
jgi:hypothetical protein